MYLAIHVPMFGSKNIESKPIECPRCPRGEMIGINDWQEKDIGICNPGDTFVCNQCGQQVIINWGLVEPDHLSHWINSEYCPHRICRVKYSELKEYRALHQKD